MRLYLSSYRLGDGGDLLRELVGPLPRAAVVLNAYDGASSGERKRRLEREFESMASLSITAEELDLRNHVGGPADELAQRLSQCGLVWVCGGDPFLLLDTMRASGFDGLLLELLAEDAIVYGGYSAGAMVFAPMLRSLDHLTSDAAPAQGLGLLPYAIAPHYRSDGHPETAKFERMVQRYIDEHILFKALRDGQVIVVRGNTEMVVGGPE